jgi:hypothetical protein
MGLRPECQPGVTEYKPKATVRLSGLVGIFSILILQGNNATT